MRRRAVQIVGAGSRLTVASHATMRENFAQAVSPPMSSQTYFSTAVQKNGTHGLLASVDSSAFLKPDETS